MKKKNLLVAALFSVAATASFAQPVFERANEASLGQACGCPSVSSRTSVNLSTLTTAGAISATAHGPELVGDTHLTCDKIWVLDEKIYVPKGVTLTIDPGTLIKGNSAAVPENATGLIVERGAKIMANGEAECPIVFTAQEDPMDGTYSITNVGKWGGIVILGTASNNLTLAKNNVTLGSGHLCVGADGIGYIEGFDANDAAGKNLFGAGAGDINGFTTFNDNDNSGVFRYVSVRHAGAILQIGNELNGISLGSVGRGTKFEHVEVVAAADDNIEYFGGTVNIKYCSTLFGDDDQFDWDLGYSGKVQFYFGISSDSLNTGNVHSTDNGFEMDADDNKAATATSNHSDPIIYNCTLVGNGHIIPSADNTGPAAIQAKELTGGDIYNSLFANFRSGLHLSMARSTATDKGDAYDQWVNDASRTTYLVSQGGIAQPQALKVKHNIFVACGAKNTFGNTVHYPISKGIMVSSKNPAIYKPFTAPSTADTTQFFQTDDNIAVETLAGIVPNVTFNGGVNTDIHSNNQITSDFHVIPTTNVASPVSAPNDGFFTPNQYYRGAFDGSKQGQWLSSWSLVVLQSVYENNPTDINQDGITDTVDYLILIGKFNQKDN